MSLASGAEAIRATATRRSLLTDLVTIALVRVLATVLVVALGFEAVSDDDFSRVVIAQRFSAAPALDPSGTSWLPLPFWLTGSAMAVFGPSLGVARALAWVTSVASAWLLYAAARSLGTDRAGALLAGILGAAMPYAARLGVATVPDGYSAALVVLAAATTGHCSPRLRAAGALAATVASLCRYEAWPVAGVVALTAGVDALRRRAPRLAAAGALALVGPAGWLLHGALTHGDPLFFVTRVASYREALGATASAPLSAVAALGGALLRLEPELMGLLALGAGALVSFGAPFAARRYARFGLVVGAVLVFVIAGEWRNAGPTHHGERAALALWLGCALVAGDALAASYRKASRSARVALLAAGVALVALLGGVVRPRWGTPEPFVDRRAEVAIGLAARARIASGERLAIDTVDYGFFAVMAAFGRPGEAVPLDDRDPRRPRPPDAFASPATLRARLAESGARWLVTSTGHAVVAAPLGSERARVGSLVLVEFTAMR